MIETYQELQAAQAVWEEWCADSDYYLACSVQVDRTGGAAGRWLSMNYKPGRVIRMVTVRLFSQGGPVVFEAQVQSLVRAVESVTWLVRAGVDPEHWQQMFWRARV